MSKWNLISSVVILTQTILLIFYILHFLQEGSNYRNIFVFFFKCRLSALLLSEGNRNSDKHFSVGSALNL